MAIELMDYKAWMARTQVFGSFRSDPLQALDKAIKAYGEAKTEANLAKVRTAFKGWTDKEGPTWKSARRNAEGAFTKLDDLLNPRAGTFYDKALSHSRLGLLYLFGKTEVEMGMGKILLEGAADVVGGVGDLPGVSMPDVVTNLVGPVKTVALKALEMKREPSPPSGAKFSLWLEIKKIFKGFAEKAYEAIKAKFSEFWLSSSWEKAETIWDYLGKIINLVAGKVFASAAPIVGDTLNILNGIKDTATGCYHRYQAYITGKGVELNGGHPGVIASSIERAMNLGIGKGLYDTLKGAGMMAANITTGGAAAVASLVIAGCELIAKVVFRLWETFGMRAFFADCKEKFDKKDKIYEDGADFTQWYRKAAYALPCLSALAINSGITGDKMLYLTMFTDRDQKDVITQAKFDQGSAYLEKLKSWSSSYLETTGYEFESKDALVSGLLKRVVASKKPLLTQIYTKQGADTKVMAI